MLLYISAANKGATIYHKSTAITHPNSIYEDIGYDYIDVPLEDVVSGELRGDSMYENVGCTGNSTDLRSEESRMRVKKDESTEQSEEVNPYMDLAPVPALPPVYTTLRS